MKHVVDDVVDEESGIELLIELLIEMLIEMLIEADRFGARRFEGLQRGHVVLFGVQPQLGLL